ncbi:APC family permease [Streptomyces sp. RPT161]|uniref:APC family permease n=1 Tax=Streptomyces sp. RPT161 TaxID=3015993 RepID=UPI0022B8A31B|nr:APC family permease [Streptomyces sp. RPT161]
MTFGLAPRKAQPRVPLRHGEGDKSRLTGVEGLAALSLDALSSVAYGPEAIVVVLVAAGTGALTAALPITLVITGLLVVLTISYCQVIAVHPDGGGAYAVAKKNLGARASLLAAASLVVDYVLTVAVSLAAGAGSLASAFPVLGHHLLAVCLGGLALLTAVNLRGIAESARFLMLPTVLFIVSILGIVVVDLLRSHPAATVGTAQPVHASESLGLLLLLKAFSSGCSALTGVEAIANGVPAFREPRVKRAQHTELMLGTLLAVMLVGLSILIRRDHVAPRGGVTVLAQLTAGAYGTGWPYYASNLIVTLALGLAANTSFGGLPVLMSLLSRDNRLPHVFGLRAERPVYRYGVVALAVLAAALLIAVGGNTQRLIPLFAIGVFIGFTISQVGLVRHWAKERPDGWVPRALINGTGAVLTAVACLVLLTTKFMAGAWVVVIAVPLLMLLFTRIHRYYTVVGAELGLGRIPGRPIEGSSLVIVPLGEISKLAQAAISAALALGGEVVALSVHTDPDKAEGLRRRWQEWNPGVPLDIVDSPQRSLVQPIVDYVQHAARDGRVVAVLIPQVEPRHRRYEFLQNQRGLLLATALRYRTDAVVSVLPYRLSV